jgi:hypothetical protein
MNVTMINFSLICLFIVLRLEYFIYRFYVMTVVYVKSIVYIYIHIYIYVCVCVNVCVCVCILTCSTSYGLLARLDLWNL